MTVESPCISICKIVAKTGICRGCGRSLSEIRLWKDATDEEKQAVLVRARARLARTEAKAHPTAR